MTIDDDATRWFHSSSVGILGSREHIRMDYYTFGPERAAELQGLTQ